jgi:periplasmic divalent cation tolerance protein
MDTAQESELVLVYVTVGSDEEARRIGRALVEERLAACINILGPVQSLYRWKGELRDDREFVMVAKTRRALREQVTARVKSLHSYECPCIVFFDIAGGHAPFLDWVRAETTP